MKIKNEKQLQEVLDSSISVPVYWQYRDMLQDRVFIDEESIREEFEKRLKEIIEAVENY